MMTRLRMDRSLRVLALIATREVSGPCRGLFQLVEQAKEMDVQFTLGMFVVRSNATSPAIEEAKRRGFEVAIFSQRRRYDPHLIAQAWKLARNYGANVLQSHGYKPALLAWCVKLLTGLPWIAFAHGYTAENRRIGLYNRLDRWLMRRADRVVVVSEATGTLLQTSGVAAGKIRVVCNAINPGDYHLQADGCQFRGECGATADSLLIGVIGRLSPEKGQRIFLNAFQDVVLVCSNAKVVFIGDGPDRVELEVQVSKRGLDGRVLFAGYRNNISSIYAALDLIVIPSLSEGLPNVLLEAMLHRKAVVATAVGGVPEVMRDGLCKWLVPAGDVDALAQAMTDALRNPVLRAELGEVGERRVREAYSPSRRAEQIVWVYRELLHG